MSKYVNTIQNYILKKLGIKTKASKQEPPFSSPVALKTNPTEATNTKTASELNINNHVFPKSSHSLQSITLGLDFGTSSTKCIINLENYKNQQDTFYVHSFPTCYDSQSTLCYPTTIGIDGDSFVFGILAEKLPESQIIHSIKIAITCINNVWGNYKSPYMKNDKPGFYNVQGLAFSAIDLSTLYLANVINIIKKQTINFLGNNKIDNVFLNLAAPLDQLVTYYQYADKANVQVRNKMSIENIERDKQLAEWYRALGQWSLKLSKLAQEKWKISDAVEALKQVNAMKLLPFHESPAYVVPETLAAIISHMKKPGTSSGRFLSIDVGAGTTDISLFWLQKQDHTIIPWYYSSGSRHVGMNDIDKALESILATKEGKSLRSKRERYELECKGLKNNKQPLQNVLSSIKRHKNRMFGKAYLKEAKLDVWGNRDTANIRILLLGGGSRSDVIYELSQDNVWENVLGPAQTNFLSIDSRLEVILPSGKSCKLSDDSFLKSQSYLLVVAEGLANKIVDIPEFGLQDRPLYEPPNLPWDEYYIDQWW